MSKKAFDKIAEGLTEALAIARGEKKPAKLHIPPEIDVRAIRARTGLSQDAFATAFGFTINQIKDWEQGRARPLGGVRAYLVIIERDARRVLELLRKAGEGKRREASHRHGRATGSGQRPARS